MDIITAFSGPFVTNMRRLAQKQHLKAKLASNLAYYNEDKYSKSYLKMSFRHKLYIFILCSVAVRLILTSLYLHTESDRLKFYLLDHDATLKMLITSIAYFRSAFTLFCVSLIVIIALTVDWLLSTKYDCLFFAQSYDLLVVNMESLFLLNDYLKLSFNYLLHPWKLIGYLNSLRSIWRGKLVLWFASARLTTFDSNTCTPKVRGKSFILTCFLEFIVLGHINGTVFWLFTIMILANFYAFKYPLLQIFQVNFDLAALFSAIFYFLYTGYAFGFSLLLVGLVYYFQLKVLNVRFSKLVSLIKSGHFSSGRLVGSSLAYHWVAHRQIMTSIDRFNGNIMCWASAAVMTYVTPYNIYLLTAITFTDTSADGQFESVDRGGLMISLTYQILVISALSFGLCVLVERLHSSAGDMHGLQLWLHGGVDRNRFSPYRISNETNSEILPVVSLHTKWKYLTHYEIVHTNAKHFFTIGPLPLSKKSAFDFTFFYVAYVLFAADLFIGKDYERKTYLIN